jgi:hypothetical protein
VQERAQLSGPDIGQLCWMYAAASAATGAVIICQRDPAVLATKAGLHPILFDSVVSTDAQTWYSPKKREIYVVVYFLRKYRHLLDTRAAPSTVCTGDRQIRNLLASPTDEAIPASWTVEINSVNVEFERVSTKDVRAVAASTITEMVFPNEDLAQRKMSEDRPLASRTVGIHTVSVEEEVRTRKGKRAEDRREKFEKWREWELGETTRDWSGWSVRLRL